MNANELEHLILQMRQIGNDTQACEVKESRNKISESIPDTLSAFSNGDGGIIILGVSEKEGFTKYGTGLCLYNTFVAARI